MNKSKLSGRLPLLEDYERQINEYETLKKEDAVKLFPGYEEYPSIEVTGGSLKKMSSEQGWDNKFTIKVSKNYYNLQKHPNAKWFASETKDNKTDKENKEEPKRVVWRPNMTDDEYDEYLAYTEWQRRTNKKDGEKDDEKEDIQYVSYIATGFFKDGSEYLTDYDSKEEMDDDIASLKNKLDMSSVIRYGVTDDGYEVDLSGGR